MTLTEQGERLLAYARSAPGSETAAAVRRFEAGETFPPDIIDIGFRAGMRDGFESTDGVLYQWSVAGHADGRYPYGERRVVIATR